MADENTPQAPLSIEERISALSAPEPARAPAEPQGEEVVTSAEETPTEPAVEQTEQATEEEEQRIADLNDLAAHIGVDVAELYNIEIPYTKNGEKRTFSLGDIKDRYQALEEATEAGVKAQKQLAAAQEAEQKFVKLAQEQAVVSTYQINEVEKAIIGQFQQVDWNGLRISNPGEFLRQQQNLQQSQEYLARIKHEAKNHFEQMRAQYSAHMEAKQQETTMREHQILMAAIPEWHNKEVEKADKEAIINYMFEEGYSPNELNLVYDHRAIMLARKAMLYDKSKKTGEAAVKKVITLAKRTLQPGGRTGGAEVAKQNERALTKAHRANPKSIDAAAARIALRIGPRKGG